MRPSKEEFEKRKALLEKAMELLRKHKHITDMSLEKMKPSRSGGVMLTLKCDRFVIGIILSNGKKPPAVKDFDFTPDWFDPEAPQSVDRFASYGNLTGENKLIARLVTFLYYIWLGEGNFNFGVLKSRGGWKK